MKIYAFILFFLSILVLSSCALSQMDSGNSNKNSPPSNTPYEPGGYGWNLIWSDEFESININSSNWTFDIGRGPSNDGWGNNELEYYTSNANNVFISNGNLIIRAMEDTSYGTAYTSARLKTRGLNSWTYGKIAARIKLPYGQGINPMFWMLGNNFDTAGWPACGEMVIQEMFGGAGNSNKTVYSGIYWDRFGVTTEYRDYINIGEPLNNAFHVYEIEWDSNNIVSRIDGRLYFTYNITSSDCLLFHYPFFMLLNLAVGGNWAGSPDGSTVFPQTMEVDWVRVYQKNVTQPLANITYPQNDTTIYGAFPIMGYSQSAYPISSTYLSVDHSAYTVLSDPTNWSTFTVLADPTNWASNLNLTAGTHNLRVYAVDISNNTSPVQEMNVTVTWEKPRVTFTSVPDYESHDRVYGTVAGVSPSLYKISLWIYAYYAWWPKPQYEAPYTAIQNDGSWSSLYNTGGVDGWADNFVAYLVPSYMPVFTYVTAISTLISNYIVTYGSYNRADLIGPSNVHFISPTNGQTILGRLHTYSFSGSFSDNIGGGTIHFSINGSPFDTTFLPMDVYNTHYTNWTGDKTLIDGYNTLSVYAYDEGYHSSSTNQITVFFINDDTPPVFTVTSPANNEHYPWPGSITLSGTANDLHGVLSVYLQMDNLEFFKANGTTNWNLVWPFLNSGTHTLRVYAEDIVTNISSTNTIVFFVD